MMRDHPGYNNQKSGRGPRTKKQRRRVEERRALVKQRDAQLDREFEELELLRREPTLHSINWKPSVRK
jgi:hypothetical protein